MMPKDFPCHNVIMFICHVSILVAVRPTGPGLSWKIGISSSLLWCPCSPSGTHIVMYFGLDRVNTLATGRSECDSNNVIFNLVLLIGIFRSSYDSVLRCMPDDLTVDKSTWVQVMAWCRQAPRSPTPYGVTRPQWVNERTTYFFCW